MTDERREKLTVRVANLDCENEAAAIERAFRGRAGVLRVEVAPKSAKVMFDVSADVPPRMSRVCPDCKSNDAPRKGEQG